MYFIFKYLNAIASKKLYMNENSGKDAFAAFCKLHLQLSVRCTLQSELQKTGTRISEELAIYGILSMLPARDLKIETNVKSPLI